jgi:hypothetical protein
MASIPLTVQPTNQGLQQVVSPGYQLNIAPHTRTFAQFQRMLACNQDYSLVMQRFDPENTAATFALS